MQAPREKLTAYLQKTGPRSARDLGAIGSTLRDCLFEQGWEFFTDDQLRDLVATNVRAWRFTLAINRRNRRAHLEDFSEKAAAE